MTKDQFDMLTDFISENLKKENPFVITTTKLFSVINYDIELKSGHKELYDNFLKYYEELNPPYNVKSYYKSEEYDKLFDIEFHQ